MKSKRMFNDSRLIAILLTISLIIPNLLLVSRSYASNDEFVINRSEYGEDIGEYYSDNSREDIDQHQEIGFNSIIINGIAGLKKPTMEQNAENHVTKYEFTLEDGMTIGDSVTVKFDTFANYSNISTGEPTSNPHPNQPVIVSEKSNLDTANARSPENLNERNTNGPGQFAFTGFSELLNEMGSVSQSFFYKYGSANDNKYELQITFVKSGGSGNTGLLNNLSVPNETGILVDDPTETKTLAAIAAEGKKEVSFEIETASKSIIPVICEATISDDGTVSEGVSFDLAKEGDIYSVNLPASVEGNRYCIDLTLNGIKLEQYILTVYERKLSGLPDNVEEFMCAPSQYVNGKSYGASRKALLSLRGFMNGNGSTTSEYVDTAPFSLGNFGGYVTYYYKNAVTDDPKNPYGIDFIIAGNSVINDALYAEPGNVYVSENGTDWYLLAGSLHYDDDAIWDASVKYEKNEDGTAKVTLPDQTVIDSYRQYPIPANYPLFDWDDENKNEMTMTGLMLKPDKEADSYSNTLPPYPAFGYADCGQPTESNKADNPYTGVGIGATNKVESSGRKDGFDLAWAVDSNGKPHKFENGIHYIKIQTNTFIENAQSGINEKSTEINFVRKAEPAPVAIGTTYDIEKDSSGRSGINISVDGKQLELKEGKYEYDAAVNGVFDVQVDTRLDSNVYINSWHGNKAIFDKAAHGIVRVIIQYGNCEPAICYINVSQEPDDNTVTAVTFDAVKGEGLISGYTKRTLYYDKDSSVKEFPVPKHRTDKVFGGWADEDGNLYSEYSEDMPAQLTLTAVWRSPVENAKLIEEITKQIQQLQEQLDTVNGQLTQAQKDLDEKDGTISGQADKITELTAQVAKISKDLEEAWQKLEEAKAKEARDAAALEEAQKTLAETQKSLEAVTKEADALRKELIDSSLDKIIASAEKTIRAAQDELSRTTNSFLREALKSVISTAEKAIETAKASVDKTNETMRDGIDAVNGLKDQVAQSTAALAKAREELDKAIAEGKASKEEAERLQKKVEEVQTELENVQKALDTSTSEKDGLQEQITQISGELSDANNKVAEAMEIIKIQQTTIKKVKAKAQKNKAKITWKKAGKGYKYEIYSSRRLSKGYKKVADIKKAKKVIKKLVSNKTYYFKVRGYKLINGEKVHTQFSEVVKVTVK